MAIKPRFSVESKDLTKLRDVMVKAPLIVPSSAPAAVLS